MRVLTVVLGDMRAMNVRALAFPGHHLPLT